MKNFKIAIVAFLMFAGVTSVQAQDEDNLWALSFGINAVDVNQKGFTDIEKAVKDYLGTSDWNTLPAISTISVSRYMNYGLSVEVSGSLNKIDKAPSGDVKGLSFFSLDASAVYDLNSIGFIGETGWFDPNIKLGFGNTWIDDSSSLTIKAAWGFNTWFNENVGLNFDSSYNYGLSSFESVSSGHYFQHSLGLIIRFNGEE